MERNMEKSLLPILNSDSRTKWRENGNIMKEKTEKTG